MDFGLNENQVMLRDSAREFFAGECPIAFVRRAAESATAHDPSLWARLAGQGYTGIIVDEAHGGVGLGIVELALLMEEAGRALLPGPLLSTVAMAGAVLDACANAEQKQRYLAPIAHGDARSTLAFVERASGWDRAAGAVLRRALRTAVRRGCRPRALRFGRGQAARSRPDLPRR